MDLSSNRTFNESTFLSAIQSHLCFDKLIISCCSGVLLGAVLIDSVGGCCALDDCKPMTKRLRPTNNVFIVYYLNCVILLRKLYLAVNHFLSLFTISGTLNFDPGEYFIDFFKISIT